MKKLNATIRFLFLLVIAGSLSSCGAKFYKRGFADGFRSGSDQTAVVCKGSLSKVGNACRVKIIELSTEKKQLLDECMASEKLLSESGHKLDCVEVK